MVNKIVWKESNVQLTIADIEKVEKKLDVVFPKDYIEIVTYNDGGYPSPNRFMVNGFEEMFNNLLSFREDDYSTILGTLENVSDRIPKSIVPIAEDPFGNLICFDFTNSSETPLVFWNHENDEENSLLFICSTFTELLNKLHNNEGNE